MFRLSRRVKAHPIKPSRLIIVILVLSLALCIAPSCAVAFEFVEAKPTSYTLAPAIGVAYPDNRASSSRAWTFLELMVGMDSQPKTTDIVLNDSAPNLLDAAILPPEGEEGEYISCEGDCPKIKYAPISAAFTINTGEDKSEVFTFTNAGPAVWSPTLGNRIEHLSVLKGATFAVMSGCINGNWGVGKPCKDTLEIKTTKAGTYQLEYQDLPCGPLVKLEVKAI